MNWTKASAFAEIISSVAVLATLIYLAIQTQQIATQTQQNTAALISNSRQQSLDAELQYLRMVLDYPIANFTEPQATGEDSVRQLAADNAFFRIRENLWLQFRDRQLDPSTWSAYLKTFVGELRRNRRIRQRWDESVVAHPNQTGFDPGFIAAVENELAN